MEASEMKSSLVLDVAPCFKIFTATIESSNNPLKTSANSPTDREDEKRISTFLSTIYAA